MSDRTPRLAFYADDFTGATDALEVMSLAGLKCALFLDSPDEVALRGFPGLDVVGIAGDSRTMSPAAMREQLPKVFERVAAWQVPLVHYKVCSTFDSSPETGSIGAVLALAKPHVADGCVPVVAATPHLQRYCLYGHLFARSGTNGQVYRLDRHPIMSTHPVTPMTESDLATHVARQGGLHIGNVVLDEVRKGASAIRLRLVDLHDAGFDAAVVDGWDAGDLKAVGECLLELRGRGAPVLVVGGSGVEHALALAWALPSDAGVVPIVRRPEPDAPLFAFSGSASALSGMQIRAAVAAGFEELPIDTPRLAGAACASDYVHELASRVAGLMAAGRSVVMHSACGPCDPRIAAVRFTLGGDPALPLSDSLAGLVQACVLAARPRRIAISGGDTSSSVARALDIRAVEICARVETGAPLCRVLQSRLVEGVEITFKGGQMGSAEFFVKAGKGD